MTVCCGAPPIQNASTFARLIEMRHWARELGQSAAKLNEAVRAVGPLVSNVRDYLRKHSLYGIPR
jgi:uncharacterized protein DUF3606